MREIEQKRAAKQFAKDWQGRGDEKQDTQVFWLSLLRKIFDIQDVENYIQFELPVKLDHTSFIDAYIPSTQVLIEQKSINIGLTKGYQQSDGSVLTPYQQARRYAGYLPHNKNPRWIIVCNFSSFEIHDMNFPNATPQILQLADLEKNFHLLDFLVDIKKDHLKREMEVSIEAGRLVGLIYDAFHEQYRYPSEEESLKSLNKLCVRLVFCLYAEDAGIFGKKGMFRKYMEMFDTQHSRKALIELFKILDTKIEDRDPYLEPELAEFPYVNGGLFADEDIEIPNFTDKIREQLLYNASEAFDWSQISPTIFGAVFESTLNPDTRRKGGMHYTSIKNIHKVIDPLFLSELQAELEEISEIKVPKIRKDKAEAFRKKLSKLTFLDPACGSGNFLTETYISLRRLENKALMLITEGQIILDFGDIIKVSIQQFYGIEINDFAVTVAKTALWIAESQMMKETSVIINTALDFLPLKSYVNIVEGNALRMDWNEVIPNYQLRYIMGNPPFIGHQWRSKEQMEDLKLAFYDLKTHGKLDYVCGWYNKAKDYIKGTQIQVAFVSTNSICQGESVGILWKFLFDNNIQINFAHRSFIWDSEANNKAHVHCVIVGFSWGRFNRKKIIFDNNRYDVVDNINGYLVDAPNVFLKNRGELLNKDMPKMTKGSQATDGGNLILSAEERESIIKQYPEADEFICKYIGAEEFINNKIRYCLWLKNVSPTKYRHITPIMERLSKVAEFRKNSPTASVQRDAEIPMLFTQIRQPSTNYLAIPRVSSENRRYIPIGFMRPNVVLSDRVNFISNADLYLFGVLTSNVHNAWMRAVCGRLGMGYNYSPFVYNNFPWPNPMAKQKAKIELTAQAILDARAKYPDSSLADLYDELTMPPQLRTAHQKNDRAVMQAYGFWGKLNSEIECVAKLMKMYVAKNLLKD